MKTVAYTIMVLLVSFSRLTVQTQIKLQRTKWAANGEFVHFVEAALSFPANEPALCL